MKNDEWILIKVVIKKTDHDTYPDVCKALSDTLKKRKLLHEVIYQGYGKEPKSILSARQRNRLGLAAAK